MAAAVVSFFLTVALAAASGGDATLVEHTFVVSQVRLNRLCNDTVVTVVNGQLPGPTIEVTEGDSVAVHVINKSPYGLTIHWHGVKQQLNCWADGAGTITQCPIQPSNNYTYRFDIVGQEGTLWWHAHVASLRASIHGALIVRPRAGPSSYPFPKPDKEFPVVIGEWWEEDLVYLDNRLLAGFYHDMPRTATINGMPGYFHNCSGAISRIRGLEHGKTYMLRLINAALYSEFYFKIAGHKFTVVGADASYVKPYTTDIIAIAPGETVDAMLVADAPPGKYHMVALAIQSPEPVTQNPLFVSRGIVEYYDDDHNDSTSPSKEEEEEAAPIMAPEMPDQHDANASFYFHGNLTSLSHPLLPPVPANVDERLYYALDTAFFCKEGGSSCYNRSNTVSMINNVSFQLPEMPLLQAHYYRNMSNIGTLWELPDRAPKKFNFSMTMEPTSKATSVRRLRYNATVEIVFQSPVMADTYSNPMHLHGHNFFLLAQGSGRYNKERDVKRYNLVDPPVRNTVQVPIYGWAVIRFVTNNPGVWFLHCHYGHHSTTGMAVAFVVEDGPTLDTTLPAPPADFPTCENYNIRLEYE